VIDAPRILAAASFYLKEHGTPLMPSDPAHHALIIGLAHLSPTFSFRVHGSVHRGASTQTSRSIATGYGHDRFTRMVAEFNY
jgi:hypothetical protein